MACPRAVTPPASVFVNSMLRLDSCSRNPTNHAFQVRLIGIANTNYVLQASINMVDWIPIATNYSSSGLVSFADPQAANIPQRFYRAVPR